LTQKRVAIIGGGASGLICAIFCAKQGVGVTLFEQNEKCAKKILVSGNGRCNITNTTFSRANYLSEEPDFVTHALSAFDFESFEKFINSLGILLEIKDDAKCYPLSNEAKSVAHILEESARNLGVLFYLGTKIESAAVLFEKFTHVVVAAGSEAAPHLGGGKDSQNFALEFGHTIVPTYPCLVQLELDSSIAHKMAGAKIDAEITLLINHVKESVCRGDILFTKYGISGFGILDISAAASKALQESNAVALSLNLLPNFTQQKLAAHITNAAKNLPKFTIFDILLGLIPTKIATHLLESLQISPQIQGDAIHTKLSKKIANRLTQWRFEVSDTHGFRHAEVSGGGISTQEINPKTMESKRHKNLYFVGEALDVVGERGGYNFAWCWASGVCAAQSIIKE